MKKDTIIKLAGIIVPFLCLIILVRFYNNQNISDDIKAPVIYITWAGIIVISLFSGIISRKKKKTRSKNMLMEMGKNAIILSYDENRTGYSKYGGLPDVPDDFSWPHDDDGAPLTLLMQVCCEELAEHDTDKIFPHSGWLYFFYNIEKQEWNNGSHTAQVLYFDCPKDSLKPSTPPTSLTRENILDEHPISMSSQMSYPSRDDFYELTGMYDTEYAIATKDVEDDEDGDKNGVLATMGGYAEVIQNSMLDGQGDSRILLMQMFTVQEKGMEELIFGDMGNIYFYIDKEKLSRRDFSDIYFELQCY